MRLSITRLWTDSDGMLEVNVSLEGNGFAANQNIYIYPENLQAFGQQLQSFPISLADTPQLEVGSPEPNAYCWLRLRAFVFDRRGHAALELSVKRNGDPQVSAESRFSVILEPASMNSLGLELQTWADNPGSPLEFERSDA